MNLDEHRLDYRAAIANIHGISSSIFYRLGLPDDDQILGGASSLSLAEAGSCSPSLASMSWCSPRNEIGADP